MYNNYYKDVDEATVYIMTSFDTSALENQLGAFTTKYRKSYNSEA